MNTKLKKLRESANLTQKEIASKIGVVQSAISMWETGESFPRTELLIKLAKLFDCTVDELLNDNA